MGGVVGFIATMAIVAVLFLVGHYFGNYRPRNGGSVPNKYYLYFYEVKQILQPYENLSGVKEILTKTNYYLKQRYDGYKNKLKNSWKTDAYEVDLFEVSDDQKELRAKVWATIHLLNWVKPDDFNFSKSNYHKTAYNGLKDELEKQLEKYKENGVIPQSFL